MARHRPPDEAAVRRLARASAWRVRLSEADAEASPGHDAWLAADPANADAWAAVQGPWILIGEAAAAPEVIAARRDALHRARRAGRRDWAGPGRRAALAGGLAAAAAVAAVWVALAGLPISDYRTALGERRVVTLGDGSRVSLDSSSEVRVRYTRDARRLELVRGQARFDVAHNVLRPFEVRAGAETVVATGTAFDIDLVGRKVVVTLIEGHISVLGARPAAPRAAGGGRPWSPPPTPAILVAGQQLIASPAAPPRIATVSLDRATAWETGQLMFDDEALGSVVARVSRYTASPVTVDPSVAGLRISGVFNTGDRDTFVDTITHYLPVEATADADGAVVLRARAGG